MSRRLWQHSRPGSRANPKIREENEVTRRLGSHSESLRVAVQKVRKNMPQEPTRSPEEEGKSIGNLLISLLAGSQILRIELLDHIDIYRQVIFHIPDNIIKQMHTH